MKRFINGIEVNLAKSVDVQVGQTDDRLVVRTPGGSNSALAVRSDGTILVSYLGRQFRIEPRSTRSASAPSTHSGEIHAPMPGMVADVLVQAGDFVQKGRKLAILEAMKTQQAFTAPFDGKVEKVYVQPKAQVAEGQILLVLVPEVESV